MVTQRFEVTVQVWDVPLPGLPGHVYVVLDLTGPHVLTLAEACKKAVLRAEKSFYRTTGLATARDYTGVRDAGVYATKASD